MVEELPVCDGLVRPRFIPSHEFADGLELGLETMLHSLLVVLENALDGELWFQSEALRHSKHFVSRVLPELWQVVLPKAEFDPCLLENFVFRVEVVLYV